MTACLVKQTWTVWGGRGTERPQRKAGRRPSSEVPKGGVSLEGEGERNAGLGARLQEGLLPAEEAETGAWGSKTRAGQTSPALLCAGLREGPGSSPGCDRQRALQGSLRVPCARA